MAAFALMTIQSLVAFLDLFTPCLMSPSPSAKERRNLARLTRLVTTIIDVMTQCFTSMEHALVVDALIFAAQKHKVGNKNGRRNDKVTPYLLHCLEVLNFLIVLGVRDVEIFVATIIHDTMEDCGATKKEIVSRFGMNVYRIVMLLSKHPDKNLEMFYWYDMKNEPEVVIQASAITIKFSDRGHSLRTLRGLDEARKKRIKEETRREFPELFDVLVSTLARLTTVQRQGLPETLAEDLHKLVFGRL